MLVVVVTSEIGRGRPGRTRRIAVACDELQVSVEQPSYIPALQGDALRAAVLLISGRLNTAENLQQDISAVLVVDRQSACGINIGDRGFTRASWMSRDAGSASVVSSGSRSRRLRRPVPSVEGKNSTALGANS